MCPKAAQRLVHKLFKMQFYITKHFKWCSTSNRDHCGNIKVIFNIFWEQKYWWHARGGHFHIMELRIRVNKNVEKGSDFCHRASSTFLEIRGQFSTTSTLRVSILNNEHRHLGSYFRPIRCCFRSPDFLGTDGRHLGMACRLLRYIVMIKRVTLVCKRDLRWKRLWYESEKLRGQLANFRRHSCPIDFHTVDVFTSAIKGRYFNRIYGQIWQIYR